MLEVQFPWGPPKPGVDVGLPWRVSFMRLEEYGLVTPEVPRAMLFRKNKITSNARLDGEAKATYCTGNYDGRFG